MGDDDIIVTTFYVKGEVSIHWDRQTGELASLYMNSTLFPDDLAADMRVPHDSSSVASSPSVDDNCSMLPSMSKSVIDVIPHATSSTSIHRLNIHELDSSKSSCTNVSVYPDVTSSNTTLMPHTRYIDCAESSCTDARVNPCVALSNNNRPPTHDRDSAKSSCTNVALHPLATSSNTKHMIPPQKGDYSKSSSTTVDVNPHMSSSSTHRPLSHEQDCTMCSPEPHNVEEKDIHASPECSSVPGKSANISCKPQAVERVGVDSSKGRNSVTPQEPNQKHTSCKASAAILSSKDKDPFEHKNPVNPLEGAKKDAKRMGGDTIRLPPSTYKNPSTASTLLSTEKKGAPSNSPHADAKSTASTLPLFDKKAPRLLSDSPNTDAKITMHGPYIDQEPSGASLSSFIPFSVEKDSLVCSVVPASTQSSSVGKDMTASSNLSRNAKISDNAREVQPMSICESASINTRRSRNAKISDNAREVQPMSICESASINTRSVVTPRAVPEKSSSKTPKEPSDLKRMFSFGLESTASSSVPSVATTIIEKKSALLFPRYSLIDAKSTTSSACPNKELNSSLSKRVCASPAKKARKQSREVDPSSTPLIDTKPVLSPWFSSTNAQCNAPQASCNSLTSSEKSSPCPRDSKSMLISHSSMEKTSDAPNEKSSSRGSIKRAEKSNSTFSSIDKNNSHCLLHSSCKDENCQASSCKTGNCQGSSSFNVTPSTSMPSGLEKMNSKSSNVSSPAEAEAKKPLPIDEKLDSLSAGQASKLTSKGTINSLTKESALLLGANSGSLSGNLTTTPVVEVTSQSSTCDKNSKDSLFRRITSHQKRNGWKRAREEDPLSRVSIFSGSPTHPNLTSFPFMSEHLKGSLPDSLIDKKPSNSNTNLKFSSVSSSQDIKSAPPNFAFDEKPAIFNSLLNSTHLDFATTFLASSAKEIKTDPSPTIGITRQRSIKAGKRPREVNLPSMELPAQCSDQTTYMGTSSGDAESLPPTFSIKKTSPISPRLSRGHSSEKTSKRPRKVGLPSSPKVEANHATTVEEKPDPSLHESVTQHRRMKARKRRREVDLISKGDDSSPLHQQLVLANPNHRPHYLDGPSSSSTSKDTSILNSRDVRRGRNKRRRTFQLSYRPMECCRPRNAFIFFSMRERQKVAAVNPRFSFGEISKLVAWAWHNMSDADKKPYRTLALEDASRYHNKVLESQQTWEHLADRGLQILYVVDLVCEWLSQKLPRWANYLSRSSLGSNSS